MSRGAWLAAGLIVGAAAMSAHNLVTLRTLFPGDTAGSDTADEADEEDAMGNPTGNSRFDAEARERARTVGGLRAELVARVRTAMVCYGLEHDSPPDEVDFTTAEHYTHIVASCLMELLGEAHLAICEKESLIELKRLAQIGWKVEQQAERDDDWDD